MVCTMLPIPPLMLTTGPVPAYPEVLAALGIAGAL